MIDYLFEGEFENPDEDFLYTKYGNILIKRILENNEWSIVVFNDIELTSEVWTHLFELAEISILLVQIVYENTMKI